MSKRTVTWAASATMVAGNLQARSYRVSRDEYARECKEALENRDSYWLAKADAIDWFKKPTTGLDDSNTPFNTWYHDGELNVSFNALDRHVAAGNGGKVALAYHSSVGGLSRDISYAELLKDVSSLAGSLVDLGVEAGDRVVIYMPMIPEAVVSMLACARIGAVHSVVFGGFASRELALRIDDADPKVILTASAGVEKGKALAYAPLVEKALELSTAKVEAVVIKHRNDEHPAASARRETEDAVAAMQQSPMGVRVLDYNECLQDEAAVAAEAERRLKATDPLYILYTSGTTVCFARSESKP